MILLRTNQNECRNQLASIRQNIVTINANIESNMTALKKYGGNK